LDERLKRIFHACRRNQTDDDRTPGIQRDHDADWRRCCIDQVGEFFTRNMVAIKKWPGDRAGHQQRDVGLDKNEEPGSPGKYLCSKAVVDPAAGLEKMYKSPDAAGMLNGCNQ